MNTNYTFQNCANATLYVPKGSKVAYEAADNWKDFKEIIEMEPEGSDVIIFADAEVKHICVENWDTNGDGELSVDEAASVNDIGKTFNCNTSITSFTELYFFTGLTSISSYAFDRCTNLTSITLPDNVKSIGSCAFYGCQGLTSIIFPNNVTSIGAAAFQGCRNLKSIKIPNSVISIDKLAFENCTNLTSVTISKNLTTISEEAFYGCTALENIVVESGSTDYDSRDNCNALIETATNTLVIGCKNTTIPNSVIAIGKKAFNNCTALTSMTIPNSVTSIGNEAFRGCTGLASVNIPNSITSIAAYAFYGCNNLTSFTIPANVSTIGDYALSGCNSLSTVTVERRNPLPISNTTILNRANATLYVPYGSKLAYESADYWKDFKEIREITPNGTDAIIFADAEVKSICVENWDTNGDGELSIDEAAAVTDLGTLFKRNNNIQSFDELRFFTNLTTIGTDAFRFCENLSVVTVPNSVTTIDYYAFDSSGITSITIPNSVTTIAECAFYGCKKLTSVIIPNSITAIYSETFAHCVNLTSVNISNSVTTIYSYAFDGCTNLTSLSIPNSVSTINSYAFKNCSALSTMNLPDNLKTISEGTFMGCSALVSITIPSNIKNIGNYVFSGCSSLTDITIPNTVTTIGSSAFAYCKSLTNVTISDNIGAISESLFSGCSSLTMVTIPKNVTSIGSTAFSGCNSLKTLIVDSRNTKYDSRDNCNAVIETASNTLVAGCKNTIIPSSVTRIGIDAFYGCKSLTSVTIPSSVEFITVWGGINGTSAYSHCSGLETIIVESGNTTYDSRENCNAIIQTTSNTLLVGCKNTIIPNSVTSIANYAFNGCTDMFSVTIPESVSSIGEYAFSDCSNLISVTVESSTPFTIKERTFTNRKKVTLYVPKGCKAAYEAANYWKEFKEIIELESSQMDQTLELTSLPTMVYGAESFLLPNTTAEGLTLSWSVANANVAKTEGNVLSVVGAGTTTVIAKQEGNDDYNSFYRGFNLTVQKAILTITAYDCQKEEGEVNPVFTVHYDGFVNSDNEDVLIKLPIVATTATTNSPAGTYSVTASGAEAANYEITYVDGTLTVIEKTAEIEVTDITQMDNAIYIESFASCAGCETNIEVKVKNSENITSYGFELVLPKGMSIPLDNDGSIDNAVTLSSRHNNHPVMTNKLSENNYKIAVTSLTSKSIKDNDGLVLTVKVQVADDMIVGTYPIKVQEPLIVNSDNTKPITPQTVSTVTIENYVKGDADADGEVDLADAVLVIRYYVGKPMKNFMEKAADVNTDGVIDLADAVKIIGHYVGKIAALSRETTFEENEHEPQ